MAILKALEADIVSGQLRSGDRLPTHRELADKLKLAVGTVTKALREAERSGLIRGDGRRGTFVGRQPAQPETIVPKSSMEPGMIDLSPFYPPANTDPDLCRALAELSTRDINYLINYTGPRGYAHHRAAGAKWVTGLGMGVDEDDVIITAGAQHAILTTFMAVADAGDVIATANHIYPGIKWVADLLGLRLVGIESDREGLLPDSFEACCVKHEAKFLYCIPTLHNPTNATLSESRSRAVAHLAEKYNVAIVEDEINRRLIDDPPPLISSIAPERSYLVASLAKVVAGGLRTCYLIAPTDKRDKILQAVLASTVMASPLLAELATMWIGDGTAERSIAMKKAEAQKRNNLVLRILKDFDISCVPTSYFIWLRLPDPWYANEFAAETRKRGVIVAPSEIFAVNPSKAEKAVRVCLGGNADIDAFERGLRIIASVIQGTTDSDSVVF